jgi:hypothetical protein
MSLEDASTHRCSRFEKISPHGAGAGLEKSGDFMRVVTLKIDEIENFTLPWRQLGEEVTDELRYLLPVNSRARIRCVNVLDVRERRFGQLSTPAIPAVPLKRDAPCNSVDPAFNRGVTAVLSELVVHEHERLLHDFIGFIGIACKGQSPPMHETMENSDETFERCLVACCGKCHGRTKKISACDRLIAGLLREESRLLFDHPDYMMSGIRKPLTPAVQPRQRESEAVVVRPASRLPTPMHAR